ncbi:MAG: hypothetical protein LC676_07945 [Loktanella sp.]|nr:hypothetical protein [Loktanella sp.]
MEPTQTPPENYWQASATYHGVIACHGDLRLSVSPNGKRYLLQVKQAGMWGRVARWRKSLRLLLPDVPETLRARLPEGLPDDPRQFPRPWAVETSSRAERMAAALPASASYAGVIFDGGDWRLIWLHGPVYACQVRNGRGFKIAAQGETVERLAARMLVVGEHFPELVAPAAIEATERLPALAADYPAPAVERFADLHHKGTRPGEGRAKQATRQRPVAGDPPKRRAQVLRCCDLDDQDPDWAPGYSAKGQMPLAELRKAKRQPPPAPQAQGAPMPSELPRHERRRLARAARKRKA